jgi:alpha-beta hydrolase superfamily lysophospholipase
MFLKTSDNVKIAYDWYPVEKPKGYLALVHMMPAVKESWKYFAGAAQKVGLAGIAIDLRGHGQSDGGPNSYQKFSDREHQKSILDLQAAVDYLKNQGAVPEQIIFVGASIGANLSLWYLADHPEFKTAVLLSAGLNYRGIKTEPLVKKLQNSQKIMLVSARDDGGNAEMNEQLAGLIPADVKKELIVYESGGHGTALLQAQPELLGRILNFVSILD